MIKLRRKSLTLLLVLLALALLSAAQIFTPDERYKADILLVVAHPDDDTVVSAYLARAIFDQHKRVAVVYCTRGDSGSNSEGRERARALGLVREIEGRQAMAALGVHNVWFLDGRDVSSQNVLVSLGAWPSASVLESLVRIFRLTRPEVVMTWLPSSVAGENHGDHQASGVLATEAFDMAGDRTVFPSQLAAPIRQFENSLEGLTPWQAKKLYYFTDAFDDGFMRGKGPEYSGKEISPSRKVSYLRLAGESAAAYYTQSPDPGLNRQIEAGKDVDEAINKIQAIGYLPDPARLLLGKSNVGGEPAGDVFQGIDSQPIDFIPPRQQPPTSAKELQVELAGPWGFYKEFWREHGLSTLEFRRPEIAVRLNDTLIIPLRAINNSGQAVHLTASATLPAGWSEKGSVPQLALPPGGEATISLPLITPSSENANFVEIRVSVASSGNPVFQTSVFVKVNQWVAEQLKY